MVGIWTEKWKPMIPNPPSSLNLWLKSQVFLSKSKIPLLSFSLVSFDQSTKHFDLIKACGFKRHSGTWTEATRLWDRYSKEGSFTASCTTSSSLSLDASSNDRPFNASSSTSGSSSFSDSFLNPCNSKTNNRPILISSSTQESYGWYFLQISWTWWTTFCQGTTGCTNKT